jgi:hypothetical protein
MDKYTNKAIDNYYIRSYYHTKELPKEIISILENASTNYGLYFSQIEERYYNYSTRAYFLRLKKSKKENYSLTREEFLSKVVSSLPSDSILQIKMSNTVFSVSFILK